MEFVFYFYIILGLIVILLTIPLFKKDKTNKKVSSEEKDLIKEELVKLKNLRNVVFTVEEKKLRSEFIKEFKKEIEESLDKIIEEKVNLADTCEIVKKVENKREEIKKSVDDLKTKQSTILIGTQFEISAFKNFIDKNSFYPREFLFEANKLEGNITDLKHNKLEDLENELSKFEEELSTFRNKFNNFKELHKEVTEWLQINDSIEITIEKQELIFQIQNAKLEKAKETFEDIKKKTTQ